VHLNNPTIKAVMVPVTSTGRINAVVSGMIDLECGSTTNTSIRKQTIDFSVTTFVTGVKAMVRMDSGINQWSDLDGKVMITTAGTISERTAKAALGKKNITMRTVTGRSHTDSFNQVLTKRADTFVNDDILLSTQIANSPDGGQLKLLPQNFAFEPYAIGLRKDDPEFKKLVDDTLIGLMKSGEINDIYKKWFMSPIPPYDTSLKVPMSSLLEEAFEKPSDIGI
jgi:glutamate/aspartate transport system substrate-binding protein